MLHQDRTIQSDSLYGSNNDFILNTNDNFDFNTDFKFMPLK